MEKLSQEYILSIAFNQCIHREELLLKKYEDFEEDIKEKELLEALKYYKGMSKDHIKMLKDKMIKLNIQG